MGFSPEVIGLDGERVTAVFMRPERTAVRTKG
jgi:hypothetical protein